MNVIGLDIGGANIKAADARDWAHTRTFALWREPKRLTEALRDVLSGAPPHDRIAVTMTGELCDCFETKREGVTHILDALECAAATTNISVWLTTGQFVPPAIAKERPLEAAASNWHALATYLASSADHDHATMLVDCGSTTTDVIALSPAGVQASGRTDTQRLTCGELVYIGARRTPLMALGPEINFGQTVVALMNEMFATIDDAMILRGAVSECPRDLDSADGRPRTRACATGRIARMIGADASILSARQARDLADAFHERAIQRLAHAIQRAAATHAVGHVIVAGSGEALAYQAVRLAIPSMKTTRLSQRLGPEASTAACAFALAMIAPSR